jgi:3-oxoacyl-[acyl-carrier protein] reductase
VDLGLKGRAALVTAASKGLGLATAEALAAEGANVVICGRHADTLSKAASALQTKGGRVVAVVADVTEPDAADRLVAATMEHFGCIDILVPNAGGPPLARALEITDAQIAEAVNANLTTSIRLSRAAIPIMRGNGWGRICCITSYAVKEPQPHLALSNLARTGLWAWAKTAAADLFPDGITLNLACPGPHATHRMVELGADPDRVSGMADPARFGQVVAFLCSEPAADVSGAAVMVDQARSHGLL